MVAPAWFLRLVKDSSASIVVATRGMASFTPNAKAWKPPKAREHPKETGGNGRRKTRILTITKGDFTQEHDHVITIPNHDFTV